MSPRERTRYGTEYITVTHLNPGEREKNLVTSCRGLSPKRTLGVIGSRRRLDSDGFD